MTRRRGGRCAPRATALLLVSLTACAGSGGGGTTKACVPTVPKSSISFSSNIQPLFDGSCAIAPCHSAATHAQNLDLSPGHSYKDIVNVPSTEQRKLKLILPGKPDESYLIQKIENAPGITPVQMPQGCPD